MSKTKMLSVGVAWVIIIAFAAMLYRWVFIPKADKNKADQQVKAKQDLLDHTGSSARYKTEINLALDSFSGYAVLRSDEFKNELASRNIKLNLTDDGADYNKRLKSLKNGEINLAAFTIDALIKSSAVLGETPATIVSIIDETKGADAMVGPKTSNIDSLNDPNTKFVVTSDSPSETLARVVMANFRLDKIGSDPWLKVNGAKEVYDQYRNSKHDDKKVFVLWEPYVSKIIENPDYKVIIDSSKFRGYIVDVLVVDRDFLIKNEETVKTVVECYFRANFALRTKRVDLAEQDAKITGNRINHEQAKKLVQGIVWKNIQENYAHFGVTGGLQHIEDMIVNITEVLRKTGAIEASPGRPNSLYYDKILRGMFEGNFHPGFGPEEVKKDRKLPSLSEEEWGKIKPVGTLSVPRLVFARGTDRLTVASEATLVNLAKDLKNWPQYYLVIKGNCSKEGDVEANKVLAEKRAKAARDWLVKNGVDENRMAVNINTNGSMTVAFMLGQMEY